MCREMTHRNPFPSLYPCDFPVKIIGIPGAEFEAEVLAIVRTHAGDFKEEDVSRRTSAGGKYISLTVRIVARSREHLDQLYAELNARESVIMVL
jgi:putative lipoic acid-binding regulatory protein